jgi:hypothetical protein
MAIGKKTNKPINPIDKIIGRPTWTPYYFDLCESRIEKNRILMPKA